MRFEQANSLSTTGLGGREPVCEHPLYTYRRARCHSAQDAVVGRVALVTELQVNPAALWTVLSDPRTWADWLTVHRGWIAGPWARFVPGARMTAEAVMLGITCRVEWTVESSVFTRALVLTGAASAGLRSRFAIAIDPTEKGLRLDITSEFSGDLLSSPVIDVIERDGTEHMRRSVAQLSALATVRRPALRLVHAAPVASARDSRLVQIDSATDHSEAFRSAGRI